MASHLSQQDPGPELQAAFRRHLPQRLRTLLRRARAQCRSGWDCNVLRALHDEIAVLAGACGRYGMLETGERLLALESALALPAAAQGIPDAAANAEIDALLDSLRPHLQPPSPGPNRSDWMPAAAPLAARDPFPRCEVPPDKYWLQLGIADVQGVTGTVVANDVSAAQPEPPALADLPHGPRVRIVNDDDPAVNELVLRLEQQGCDVALVDHLDGLVEALRKAPPDLAILVADAQTGLDALAAALHHTRRDPAHRVRLLVLLRTPDVELQLRALRSGADRCVALPASSEEIVGAAVELASVDQESAYRILIVDDDAPQALFAQAILRRAGMETKVLGESLAVLDELDRFRPDLLLLDLNMPDCDGFELTALIRERDGYVNTPIVFLSGDQDEERQFAALDAGGDDFLVKPIRPTHLVAAVTNRVRRARMAASRALRKRRRDAGTGLHDRSQLLDALSEHFAASGGRAAPGGLLALEVEAAAALRSHLGLASFDQLLSQIGAFVVGHARVGCMTARHGNAGYLIFAPARGEAELAALARELIDAAHESRFGAQASAVRLACAVCAFDASTSEPAQALAAVERTLSAARAQPDEIAIYSKLEPDPNSITQRLAVALATGSLGLAFQPILPIRGAAEPQYQALLRLRADGREHVAAELVPVAIRTGSIAAIDAWVVQRCIAILAERMRDGDPVRLFASQSLLGWSGGDRASALRAALAATGVQAGSLILEFRAEEVRHNMRTLLALAPELRQMEVRLSLAGVDADAVAAGWIEHLALDYVKLAPGLDDLSLAAVVQTAHERGLRVVAPCVESVAEVERLRATGIDLLQGNHFRPPANNLDEALPQVGT
jgi:PleD family two-component response regulator/EAL domain-containing protein (putative c-di-GMP-specific phosphodiesterase class I)